MGVTWAAGGDTYLERKEKFKLIIDGTLTYAGGKTVGTNFQLPRCEGSRTVTPGKAGRRRFPTYI